MSELLQLRVRVMESWDDIVLQMPAPTSVGLVKQLALDAMHLGEDPRQFVIKFRGAELRDETRTLADERIPSDAALIVMRRRRVPVR